MRLRSAIVDIPKYRQGRPAPAGGFKLSSNENPYPPLPGVVQAIQAQAEHVNRYPAPGAPELAAAIAAKLGVTKESVLVTDGSVAAIAQLLTAVAGPGDEVVYAWRSFEAYPLLVAVTGARSVQVPLGDGDRHDLQALAAAVTERTRAVFVCNPNNPTGTVITQAEWDGFIEQIPSDVLVVLDEAYIEFVTEATVDGIASQQAHDNVVILRTFSKAYGLAGLRVGYAIGAPEVLEAAALAGVPLSVTALASAAGLASIEREGELFVRVEQLAARRDALQARLRELDIASPPSQSNFVWFPVPAGQHERWAETFERHGIIVRPFPEGIRVTIGEAEADNAIIAAALEAEGKA